MLNELLFGSVNNFQVVSAEKMEGKVLINVESTQNGCNCPLCNVRSLRIHSYYFRTILDLPILGNETWIRLRSRKFYCRNDECIMKVFTERFDVHFTRGKRITKKVYERASKIALLLGGKGGEKLCPLMNMPVSRSALIRRIHESEVPSPQGPRIIGLDDWAYRKGLKYGTVLVDMEKRKIIDLLPVREAETVEKWLKQYPKIEVVSRDRYINYATRVSKALPEAQQVADRWHLIKNLGEAVKKVLERTQGTLKQKAKLLSVPKPSAQELKPYMSEKTQQTLAKKQSLIDEAKRQHKEGIGIRAISRTLQINRATVRKYLQMEAALPKSSPLRTKIFLYEDYIRNAVATRPGILIKDLYEDIKALGYEGKITQGYVNISKYVEKHEKIKYPKDLPLAYWRPAQVSLLLYRNANELHNKDKDLLEYLIKESTEIETCYCLFQRFRAMLESKDGNVLRKWVDDAVAASIKELRSFGQGILSDFSAVQNAVSLPWSNGQVEGQVNKLKMLKRQIYGRASINLLRKRLVGMNG
jgi:transposase